MRFTVTGTDTDVGKTVFSAALSGVFRTALYRYAMLGEEFGGFTHEQIAGAFRPKKR